jgi:hypothetical protein
MAIDLKEAGRKGGKASWEKLTPEQRAERVRKAGLARVAKLSPEERSKLAQKAGRARGKTQKITITNDDV